MEKFFEEILKIYNDNQVISLIICGIFLGLIVLIVLAIVLRTKKESGETVLIEEIKHTDGKEIVTEKEQPLVVEEEEIAVATEPVKAVVVPPVAAAKQKVTAKPKAPQRVAKGKYIVFPNNLFFQYVLKASNGEVLVTSDLYKTKQSAMAGAKTLKENIVEGIEKIISQDKFGLWQFRFVQNNSRVVALSASYDSEKSAISAAESTIKFGATAEVTADDKYENPPFIQIIDMDVVSKDGGRLAYQSNEHVGFYFQLVAPNGVNIFTSEVYRARNSCKTGVQTLRNNVAKGIFVVTKDKRGFYQFKLYTAALNRVIAVGESYSERQQAIANAKSVATYIEKAV